MEEIAVARSVLVYRYADVVVHATDGILQSASPRQVGLAFGSGSTCKGHKEPALRDRREPPGIDTVQNSSGKKRSDATGSSTFHGARKVSARIMQHSVNC